MTTLTEYLNCEYKIKESSREAFLEQIKLTLDYFPIGKVWEAKKQKFKESPKQCLEECEQSVVKRFYKRPDIVSAWMDYDKNVIVTLPIVWEMLDVTGAKMAFYFEPLMIYGLIKEMYDTLPATMEAEVDTVIKSTKGEMNYVLNKIKRYVLLEDVWEAPINGKTIMNFFFVILGLVDGSLTPEHKEELPKMVFDFLTKGKGAEDRPLFELGFSKFIGLFASRHYLKSETPVELSTWFFNGSKQYNDDIGKGKSHKAKELKAFHNICEMAEGYLPEI